MILDTTTKKIQLVLGEAISANQMDYVTSYSDITTTTFTPTSSDGTSNGTTPVDIIAAPSSSHQINVNAIYLHNNDTITHQATINLDDNGTLYQLYTCSLKTLESIKYTKEQGWQKYSAGGLSTYNSTLTYNYPSMITNANFLQTANITTATTVSNAGSSNRFVYLGVANKSTSSISIQYRLTTNASVVTWAELAVYRAVNMKYNTNTTAGTDVSLEFLGYLDTSAVWTGGTVTTSTVTLSTPLKIGDIIWVGFANLATTGAALRSFSVGDALDMGLVATKNSGRPSLAVSYNRITTISAGNGVAFWISGVCN